MPRVSSTSARRSGTGDVTSDQQQYDLLTIVKRGDRVGAVAALKAIRRSGAPRDSLDVEDSLGDGTALIRAAGQGFDELVDGLLAAGANVNARSTVNAVTALHAAAERGHINIVRKLLEYKADVNCVTSLAETPCHLAAYHGHVDTVRTLIDAGADWTLRNWRRNDVLDEAIAAHGHCPGLTTVILSAASRSRCSRPVCWTNDRDDDCCWLTE